MRGVMVLVLMCCPFGVAFAQESPLEPPRGTGKLSQSASHKKPRKVHHPLATDAEPDQTAADLPTAHPKTRSAETSAGPSFGLKWHATSDPINPFEDVQHTAGPSGPGDALEAGVKIGF